MIKESSKFKVQSLKFKVQKFKVQKCEKFKVSPAWREVVYRVYEKFVWGIAEFGFVNRRLKSYRGDYTRWNLIN